MEIIELAGNGIRLYLVRFLSISVLRLSDSTTLMSESGKGYQKGARSKFGARCGKNDTQLKSRMASTL